MKLVGPGLAEPDQPETVKQKESSFGEATFLNRGTLVFASATLAPSRFAHFRHLPPSAPLLSRAKQQPF
jgi:hypothetical protein